MSKHTAFRGPYVRMDLARLREKAGREDDPRNAFYRAMLDFDSYEDYYRAVGDLTVEPKTYRSRPVTAHAEIRYARTQMGWLADREI